VERGGTRPYRKRKYYENEKPVPLPRPIDATGVSGTILLTSGELLVTNSVTILGPGPADLAVNGNAASRVFHISGTRTESSSSAFR